MPDAVNRPRFRQVRYAENVRAALHQERGDLFQSVAVGVGFDDGQDLHLRPDPVADPRQVPPQCIQVNFGPTTERVLHAVKRKE